MSTAILSICFYCDAYLSELRIICCYGYANYSSYFVNKDTFQLTLAVPRSLTTQTSTAVLPLITVTFVGVVGSIYGGNVVVEVVGVVVVDDAI